MRKVLIFMSAVLLLAACAPSVTQVGRINMISNRNVDPKLNYQVLTTYSGGSKKELKKTRSESIEDAVDQTVRKIAGGEFLMNAKIYLVDKKYFAVEGDVWGVGSNIAYRGFQVGDKVLWKSPSGVQSGKIKSHKDDKTCYVETENGKLVELKYEGLSKEN